MIEIMFFFPRFTCVQKALEHSCYDPITVLLIILKKSKVDIPSCISLYTYALLNLKNQGKTLRSCVIQET